MTRLQTLLPFFSLIIAFTFFSCNSEEKKPDTSISNVKLSVSADVETTPVASQFGEDAADDPAIWINHENLEKSTVIGTNKKSGLVVYNLDGEQLYYYSVGKINNVDLRYGFPTGKDTVDFVAGSNRTDNSLLLMKINKLTGELENFAARSIICGVDEVYGMCLYKSPFNGRFYVFVGGKDGTTEQFELFATEQSTIDARLVRTLKLSTQSEGMVADDETGYLYMAEEDGGLWKFNAEPDSAAVPQKIAMSDTSNHYIHYDLEGVSIYYAAGGKGYLVVSSQGNYSYALFEREGDNKYVGSFRIADGTIDGVEETDGLDVTNVAISNKFPNGFLVVQDGFNYRGDTLETQNFKIVAWEKITNLFTPQLLIDNTYRDK